ncbi:MAG: hypothetical protein NTW21_08105 [Verrucomicrobia bacterium]|nr:hypothetical protein [Verrucomicrobiota bacterium]
MKYHPTLALVGVLRMGALSILLITSFYSSSCISVGPEVQAFHDISWIENMYRQKALDSLSLTESERLWIKNNGSSWSSSASNGFTGTHRLTHGWNLPTGAQAKVSGVFKEGRIEYKPENLSAKKIPAMN